MNVGIGGLHSRIAIGESWVWQNGTLELRFGNWKLKAWVFFPRRIDDIEAVLNVLTEELLHFAIEAVEGANCSTQFDALPLRVRNAICFNEWEGADQ